MYVPWQDYLPAIAGIHWTLLVLLLDQAATVFDLLEPMPTNTHTALMLLRALLRPAMA